MLLPPSPLRLQKSFVWKYQLGGLALLAVGIAAGTGYAVWQYGTVDELLEQSRIWREGQPATQVRVDGNERTNRFIFHEYTLEVEYVSADQVQHNGTVKFDTLGGEVDRQVLPAVHYLKDDPHQFALSWAVEANGSRWCSIAFMAIAGLGLIGGSFSILGWRALRRLAYSRRCAVRSDEVVVQVTKITEQKVHGNVTALEISYTGRTDDGREVVGKTSFPVKTEPLWADSSRQRMVALVPPENARAAVVLRGDFWPFELTADEQAKVRAAIAARG